jgi:archaellum component FlaC
MIEERIQNIETKVQATGNIPEDTKAELLALLEGLKSEVSALEKTHSEEARSIARFADASAHEATRQQKKPALIEASLSGLKSSVEGLEVEHPKIVQIVNRLATILSHMGI